jgi:hypothetical protein
MPNRKHVQVWTGDNGRGYFCLVYANGDRGPHTDLDTYELAVEAAKRDFPGLEVVLRRPEE